MPMGSAKLSFRLTMQRLLVLLIIGSVHVEAQEQDLTDVTDPLQGAYTLFAMYDLYYPKMFRNNDHAFVHPNQWKVRDDYAYERIAPHQYRADCDPYASLGQNLESIPARLFDLPYDTIVHLLPKTNSGSNCGGDFRMTIQQPYSVAFMTHDVGSHDNVSGSTEVRSVAADFTGNGFHDVFSVATSYNSRTPTYFLTRAVDSYDSSKGLETIRRTGTQNEATGWGRATAGDFDGDGNMDVAYVNSDRIVIVTVCGRVFEGVCNGKVLGDVVKRPMIDTGMHRNNNMQSAEVVAGKYVTHTAQDDLFYTHVDHSQNSVMLYTFDENMNAKMVHRSDSSSPQNAIVMADAGPVDFWGRGDSAVFAVDHYVNKELIMWHVTFDGPADKPMRFHRYQTNKGGWRLRGLAAGRYRNLPDDGPTKPDEFDGFGIAAIFVTDGGSGALEFFKIGDDQKPVRLWGSEKGAGSIPGTPSGYSLLDEPFKFVGRARNFLYKGDLQGRSVKLGAPDILRVPQHMQPWIAIGKPPMHVDIIQPWGFTERTLFNFSAVPSDFYTKFSMSQEDQTQSSHTAKTAETHAVDVTIFGKKSFGAKLNSVNIEFEAGGGYAKEEWVDDTYSTYQKQRFDLSQQTGTSDLVGVSGQRKTYYIYPVIGQTTCPDEMETCSPAEEVPLNWIVAMPDQTFSELKGAELLEWYQPIHEPFNVFSYPWHHDQLKFDTPDLKLLTNTNIPSFATDSAAATYQLQWSAGAGESQTTGTKETGSWHTKFSLSVGSPKWAEHALGKHYSAGVKAAYNGSKSWGDVDTSSTSLGASQGVKIAKPGSLPDGQHYAYGMKPYIFSEGLPEWSTKSGDDLVDILDEADQAAWGALTVAYTVDVDPTNSIGSFWATSPYRTHIDIALNNPVRYQLKVGKIRGGSGEEVPKNCIPAALNQDKLNCMLFRVPIEDDELIWNDAFYRMRGFFMRPYSEIGADGPARATADEGDQMLLEVRVYNYSMLDMPPNSKVKVRFYRQEMDSWLYRPVGDSVLVGEDTLLASSGGGAIRGHSNADNEANWRMASTVWDTTGLGNTYFSFWVVAWAEDADGNLIEELQDHGLDAEKWSQFIGNSPTQTIRSIVDVPLEYVTLLGIGDIPDPNGEVEPIEMEASFTNNVGFFKQLIYVLPPESELPSRRRTTFLHTDGKLDIVDLELSASTVEFGKEVALYAKVFSYGEATEGLAIKVSLGDPDFGAETVDMELLPYIGADDAIGIRTTFRGSPCGIHNVTVIAGLGKKTEVRASTALEVVC
eukprot:Clim_evm15s15 gene=Clim_evmTU15s15